MENTETGNISTAQAEACKPKDKTLVQKIFSTGLGSKIAAALGITMAIASTSCADTKPEIDKTPVNPASAMATRTAKEQATATQVAFNKESDAIFERNMRGAQPPAVQTQQAIGKQTP